MYKDRKSKSNVSSLKVNYIEGTIDKFRKMLNKTMKNKHFLKTCDMLTGKNNFFATHNSIQKKQ